MLRKTMSMVFAATVLMSAASADTIIRVKPELAVGSDGKVSITNALPFCPDATSIVIDTNTVGGKALYAFGVAANTADKTIYVQTACTCSSSCGNAPAPVFKMCSVLAPSGLCW